MANLTVKNLPDDLHKRLKAAARSEGRSLNAFIIQTLELTAEEHARRQRMRRGWSEYLKFRATLPDVGDSTELIREDRDRLH